MKKMKFLFAFPLFTRSTSYELYKSLQKNITLDVFKLFTEEHKAVFQNSGSGILSKIAEKLKVPLDYYNINQKLLNYDLSNIDILFTIKGNTIKPSTLKTIKSKYPKIKILSWSLDDMYAWHNRSLYYTFGLKHYDIVFTTKSYNVKELKLLGARNVKFLYQAYSKDIHKKYDCDKYKNIDVLFIGYFELERFKSMLYLAKHGVKVDIYGPKWEKYTKIHQNLVVHNKLLAGEEYSKALSNAKISLCFLRKINRDLHTSRSLEIPACGGCMVAERTDEHKQLFEEDKEAVYFESNEELLEKVKYYLEHERERRQIAEAGYIKTREAGYSYDDRVEEILRYIHDNLS